MSAADVILGIKFTLVAALAGLALATAACRERAVGPPAVEEAEPRLAAMPTARPATAAPMPRATRAPATPAPFSAFRATPPPAEIWKEFSGDKAMFEVVKQVEIGPRVSGTPEAEKARAAIEAGLLRANWEIERQEFTGDTPRGPVRFVNLIARFGAGRPAQSSAPRAIVCSHYDTKRFSTIRFVGASDGASSTGALIELGRVLALDPALATQVELVFFDGEEAVVQFTETDGLYGSRFYAQKLRESGRAAQFKFAILWDMIGDRDLTITLPPDSPRELAEGIFAAATALGVRQHFGYLNRDILDDHVPLNKVARIPAIDLIDFDYPYWHTQDDTLDKLSAASLQKIGAVTLYHLRKALR